MDQYLQGITKCTQACNSERINSFGMFFAVTLLMEILFIYLFVCLILFSLNHRGTPEQEVNELGRRKKAVKFYFGKLC